MKRLKKLVKGFIWAICSNKEGLNKVRILSGPAKGARLAMDIRKGGSYWLGTYDDWILKSLPLDKIIKNNWVVWDCGAFYGYYTAIFRKTVNNGIIHTFEASGKNFDILKTLPALNNWDNVFIHHLAVGPDHSSIKFVNNMGGSNGPFGLSKIYNVPAEELEIEEVRCCGVDELVYEMKVEAPDFIKFDLESAEEFALHNGDRLFVEKKPTVLLELHGEAALIAAGRFLERFNYQAILPWEFNNPSVEMSNLDELQALQYIPHMIYCSPK